MYSEENDRLAEVAYSRYRSAHDASLPEWDAYGPKHIWHDLVQTFEANPRSHNSIANAMEQCVSDVLNEKADGAIPQPAKKAKAILPEPEAEKPKAAKPKK